MRAASRGRIECRRDVGGGGGGGRRRWWRRRWRTRETESEKGVKREHERGREGVGR